MNINVSVVGAALLAWGLVGISGCGQGAKQTEATPDKNLAQPAAESTSTNQPAVRPEFAKLRGQWQRPDGGYVLEIRSIGDGGVIEAGYFNPSPIRVSKALAMKDAEGTKVFIELRDTGYPGCTYSLKYDPKTDQLYGEYFQAAMQQTYDVTFGRAP